MLELQVVLDFECCACGNTVGVTLKCEGEGLSGGLRSVAAVKIPCPTCGVVNQLYFEPNGTVRDVVPCESPRRRLVPSLN